MRFFAPDQTTPTQANQPWTHGDVVCNFAGEHGTHVAYVVRETDAAGRFDPATHRHDVVADAASAYPAEMAEYAWRAEAARNSRLITIHRMARHHA